MDIGPIPEPQYLDATMTSAAGWPPSDISADSSLPTPAEASLLDRNDSKKSRTDKRGPTPHLDYLRNLQRKQPPKTTMQRFGSGYQDYLQSPLQPLTDNLDSVTYEVFENDPVKYDLYYQAIVSALNDWRSQNKPASGTDGRIVVAVVGAGRGPLVTRALRASESEGVPIELWALEKNQNAFVLLQQHNEETWGGRVNLVKSDMRSWKGPLRQAAPATVQSAGYTGQWPPPRDDDDGDTSITLSLRNTHHNTHPTASPTTHIPIDILISELLGSLGDNELSPECLDGITPLLNRTHGISIPRSYTAFLTPISAPKIHADLLARSHTEKSAPNTPWVVMLHAVDFLSATASSRGGGDEGGGSVVKSVPNILPIWTFTHTPGAAIEGNRHNERQARVSFNLRDRAVCHGLAGYFEAELYPGVELSTNPLNMDIKSEGMMSWFPIYFPLKVCATMTNSLCSWEPLPSYTVLSQPPPFASTLAKQC